MGWGLFRRRERVRNISGQKNAVRRDVRGSHEDRCISGAETR
jgi:hypothetical protein